jgi:hypothetical protein
MPRETNPRGLSDAAVSILVSEDHCPMCLGHLDTGWECNECGFDAMPWITTSRAEHERRHDNREG